MTAAGQTHLSEITTSKQTMRRQCTNNSKNINAKGGNDV